MPARSVVLAKSNENKVHLARLQLCYRTQSALVVRSPRQQGRSDAMSLSKSYELQPEDFCKLSDEELTQRVASGHHNALAILFDRYHRLVFDVAVRIVRDPAAAEVVVQTVFLDTFPAMADFESRKGIL